MRLLLTRVLSFALVLAFVCVPMTALAKYPSKPITLVAPYGPGGASDLAARTLAAAVNKYIGQPVVVINRTGAGGVTGSAYVSKRAGDGYTLLLGRVGCSCLVPALNKTIPYKWDDFTFIGMLELNPFVYVVKADSPYKTLKELTDDMKKNPGKLSFSNSGPYGLLAMGLLHADRRGRPAPEGRHRHTLQGWRRGQDGAHGRPCELPGHQPGAGA